MSSFVPPSERSWRFGTGVLLALISAKALVLTTIGVPGSRSSTAAFFWQDAAAAAIVGPALGLIRPAWMARLLFGLIVAVVAVSAPVTSVLGSPLTWTMIRAARGALSDSIAHHVTAPNLAMIGVVWTMGVIGRRIARALPPWAKVTTGTLTLAVFLVGIWSARHVDTAGLDRNALTALIPRIHTTTAAMAGDAPRHSPFPEPRPADAVDLGAYRGTARGMNVLLIVLESTAAQYLKPYWVNPGPTGPGLHSNGPGLHSNGAPDLQVGGRLSEESPAAHSSDDPMPTLSALAQHALIYDRAYAAYPESVKGLYSTLCGRMPVFGAPAERHAELPCASIARSFGDAGYRTALFHSGRFAYLGMAELLRDKGFMQLEDAGAIGGHVQSSFGVDESATVERMLRWIDDADATTPFFAAYLPVAGHHPYATTRPGPFEGTSEFGRYKNALHEADEAVHQLLQGLHDRALDRKTVVMIVGDHGEAFGQHPGNAGHSLFIYEENVHVPWLISVPGLFDAGRHVNVVTSLVDVPSTLRDLAGLPADARDQGQGLGRGQDPIALFFSDYSLNLAGLRDHCWTYIYEAESDRSRLFDVCRDPAQTHDRSDDERARVVAYHERVFTAVLGQSGNMVGQR